MTFPVPVHYSREDTPGWRIHDWEIANSLLSYLSTDGRSFMCFERPDGSYVQCAGSKTRLTVEARIYFNEAEFGHFVFGLGPLVHKEEQVQTTDYHVTVDASQVLLMRHLRLILKPWLMGEEFPPEFTATDITHRFTEQGDIGE